MPVEEGVIVRVYRVHVPAMSTIGYGWGKTEDGSVVEFAGDHRPMRELGEALSLSNGPLLVVIEPWQIVDTPSALLN